MKKSIILLRGVPGCGKTTFAELMSEGRYPVISADDYFMKDGKYEFDMSKIGEAHSLCQFKVHEAIFKDAVKIFVANTFTQEWEMEPYFDLAEEYHYDIFVIIVENRHGSSNIHGCPEEHIKKMRTRFQIKL
jgi:dephospho-CoA kinase